MILYFDDFISHTGSYGKNNFSTTKLDGVFFQKRGYCPFCKINIHAVYQSVKLDNTSLPGGSIHLTETVWECEKCGWWEKAFEKYVDAEIEWDIKDWEKRIDSAILKKFDEKSNNVPVAILREYLWKNPEKIYNIHHKKMEELVGAIFKEHYNCEVHHVGKTGDGGRDLILIESNKPVIVQVKRRESRNKAEAASCIRELIGATLLGKSRDCIFVTTAKKFSKQSIKHKEDALSMNIIDSFELYDVDKFLGLLKLNNIEKESPWKSLIELK